MHPVNLRDGMAWMKVPTCAQRLQDSRDPWEQQASANRSGGSPTKRIAGTTQPSPRVGDDVRLRTPFAEPRGSITIHDMCLFHPTKIVALQIGPMQAAI